MGLNSKQQAAVSYLEGPLLVLAGPGTGKTQLLSAKVAYILENTDTNPENILCLTFTESGASNMRERLGTMIGNAAHQVNIFTYHAFGANILERYKSYAENFDRNLDAAIDEVMQYKLVREIQHELPSTDILKQANVSDLISTISQAKSARLSAADLRKIAEVNLVDSEQISELASQYFAQLVPRMKVDLALEQVYQPLALELAAMSGSEPITQNIERTANLLTRELGNIIQETKNQEKPKLSPLSKWKTDRFECDTTGNYRLKDYIANKKLLSLANIMQQYDQKLHAEGLFDFADMIEEAIRALRDDEGFRLSMSEIFQYILLDEFQDTNPSQFEIIKLLTAYENPIVMAVGDDDQAIFAFQGANASNLLDFQNYYQAKVINLEDNYRSTGEILDFSYHIAEQVEDSFAKHHGIVKKLRSMMDLATGRTAGNHTSSRIERHEFLSAHDEYYWIAQNISQLLRDGVSADEIAVIAPKHKYIAPLLPYLKEQNINIAYEKRSNLLEDVKLNELNVIARFVFELAKEQQPTHRLLEILAFPFLNVSPLTALRAVSEARESKKATLDYLAEADDKHLAWIAQWLAELAMAAFEAPLELWLDYLTGIVAMPTRDGQELKSPYLDYYTEHCSDLELFELYENINTLKNTALNHTKSTRPKLEDYIAMLDDYTAAEAAIIATSPYRDSAKAVQIMSAHKSKGLEFKYVFLIAVDDTAWGKAKGNNNLFSLPRNLLQIRHTGITNDEQVRLLFVAVTRAKNYLIMTNSVQDFFEKPTARLQYLAEQRDEKASEQISPYLEDGRRGIIVHQDEADLNTKISTLCQSWTSAYQKLTPDLRLMLESRVENYRLTASDLTSFIDLIYAGPEAVYRTRILRAPEEPLTTQLAYGILIHSALEQVINQKLSPEVAIAYFQEKAAELPLLSHDIKELQEKGQHGLEIALRQFGDILKEEHTKAEVNLSSEHLAYDGIPLTGKIDLIKLDPEARELEIYDYKTGKFHNNKWQSHPTLYKYALQLEFYKLLLNLSPTYSKYKVTKGHILFVSPDEEGKVYDKVYEYDSLSGEELKKLAKTVYGHIKNLDFLDDPELNLSADKSRTLKDIKNFVEKLIS